MTHAAAMAFLALPAVAVALTGSILLRRALARPVLLPEELALAGAWVFAAGSLVWLEAALADAVLLGFGRPWTWLAAAHFAAAGFGALTITALTCRAVSVPRLLRVVLVAHPVAYLITAAGISGFRFCNELGASIYEAIFVAQLGAFVFGGPHRMRRGPTVLLGVALTVPVVTGIFAISWAFRHPIFDLAEMVRYHGIVNAGGHIGASLLAFAWGRPRSHAPRV